MPVPVSIGSLVVGQYLPFNIYSGDGEVLLYRGRLVDAKTIEILKSGDAENLYTCADSETDVECVEALRFQLKPLDQLCDFDVVARPVYDTDTRLLVPPGRTISADQRLALQKRGVRDVCIERKGSQSSRERTTKLLRKLAEAALMRARTPLAKQFETVEMRATRVVEKRVKYSQTQILDLAQADAAREIRRDGGGSSLFGGEQPPEAEDIADAKRVREIYARLYAKTSDFFAKLENRQEIDGREIGNFARETVSNLVGDRFHRMHLYEEPKDIDYLAAHSLGTMILAVNIACRMNYSLDAVFEIAYGALLHDIGMLRIPKPLREKPEPVTEAEKRTLHMHPGLGLDLCSQICFLPVTTAIVAYQENERLDGTGYPRGLSGRWVHPFTRVVSMAAAYDAMVRERPHREALHPYEAMASLLGDVKQGRFDPEVMRAFLDVFSLFPVGSGVQVSDGRQGVVIAANEGFHTRPVVLLDRDQEGKPSRRTEIVDLRKVDEKDTRIIRPVTPPKPPTGKQTAAR